MNSIRKSLDACYRLLEHIIHARRRLFTTTSTGQAVCWRYHRGYHVYSEDKARQILRLVYNFALFLLAPLLALLACRPELLTFNFMLDYLVLVFIAYEARMLSVLRECPAVAEPMPPHPSGLRGVAAEVGRTVFGMLFVFFILAIVIPMLHRLPINLDAMRRPSSIVAMTALIVFAALKKAGERPDSTPAVMAERRAPIGLCPIQACSMSKKSR